MSRKKQKYSPYKTQLCYKALDCVFDMLDFSLAPDFEVTTDGVWLETKFKNKFPPKSKVLTTLDVLYQSYRCNLGKMREYARDKGIDEIAYILSLRDILLMESGVNEL